MSARCWLKDDVWYACIHCEKHGWVDEAVTFDDAKTEWKACEIASQRHENCTDRAMAQKEAEKAFAIGEIEEARRQLQHYEGQAKAIRSATKEQKEWHDRNVTRARERLKDVIQNNQWALDAD